MNARIWLVSGFLIMIVSLIASVFYANQIMNQIVKAQAEGGASPNIDLNAAIYSSIFVAIGFAFIIIGLIKHLNKKNGNRK